MAQHEDFKLLNVQTWLLKFKNPCDCKGCKNKLNKAIKSINGVGKISSDVQGREVTFSANEVSANFLWTKLQNSGKHAELLLVPRNNQQNNEHNAGKVGRQVSGKEPGAAPNAQQKPSKDPAAASKGRKDKDNGQLEEENLFSDKIVFRMETLVAATDNFHDDNKLGRGGFGIVYKGTTQDGKQIAVKKLSPTCDQGPEQFLNEVKVLSRIQHRNCVKLLGCCAEGSEKLLVYEYLPNKSLDDANKVKGLDWQQRYGIILGVARGLLYLHRDSEPQIVHRDIKPSNILLDNKLNPKIADFGVAKLFPEDKTHLTTGAVGTFGYVAPEYFEVGRLSKEADVYSFGVVLLELITGRNIKEFLLKWVWSSYEQGNIRQTIDGAIIERCDVKQALRCIRVGLLCTQADSSCRPSMVDVISMLSNGSTDVPPSKIPAYVSSVPRIAPPSNANAGASITKSAFRILELEYSKSRKPKGPFKLV